MKIGYYVAKRLLLLIPVLFGVTLLTFAISHVVPGDPVLALLGPRARPEARQAAIEKWHLDKPLPEQYIIYVSGLLHGDLGEAIHTRKAVADDLIKYFPATFELSLVALFFFVASGIPLGTISAIKRDKPIDHFSRLIALFGSSMPVYWLGLVALLIFYYRLGWVGIGRIATDVVPPTKVTGLYLLDSLVTANGTAFVSSLRHILLPAMVLGFSMTAIISRMVRSSMLEVLDLDYIRTARAKGLHEKSVNYGHALRNALIPATTMIGLMYGSTLGGTVLIETIFSWPGIGSYAVASALTLDFPAIMGVTLVYALSFCLVNLIVDVLYGILDPRIKYS